MILRNKYVTAISPDTLRIFVGVIPSGGYHQDWSNPAGTRIRSAGWFSYSSKTGEIKTFGESFGFGIGPEEGDVDLILDTLTDPGFDLNSFL
jgi:hypothetical protein